MKSIEYMISLWEERFERMEDGKVKTQLERMLVKVINSNNKLTQRMTLDSMSRIWTRTF